MAYDVAVRTVRPQLIAAVSVPVRIGEVAQAFKPALDQVWAFLRSSDGAGIKPNHNFFLYHHPARRDLPMEVDFGVEVDRAFEAKGNVRAVETPQGEVAWTLHVGPYDGLPRAHNAVHAWCAANKRAIGGASWEIYGDWNADHAKLETTISYLLV